MSDTKIKKIDSVDGRPRNWQINLPSLKSSQRKNFFKIFSKFVVRRKPVWAAAILIFMTLGNFGGYELIGEAKNLTEQNISASKDDVDKLPKVEVDKKEIFKDARKDFQAAESPQFVVDISIGQSPPAPAPLENIQDSILENVNLENINPEGSDDDISSEEPDVPQEISGEESAETQDLAPAGSNDSAAETSGDLETSGEPSPADPDQENSSGEKIEEQSREGDEIPYFDTVGPGTPIAFNDVPYLTNAPVTASFFKNLKKNLETFEKTKGEFAQLPALLKNESKAASIAEIKSLRGVFWERLRNLLGIETAGATGERIVKTEILNASGEVQENITTLVEENGETAEIKVVKPDRAFRPGKYSLRVEMLSADGTQVLTSTQDFTWGVLAINVNKSIFSPDETAKISMAVLDENGKMICDAKLKLEVRSEKWEVRSEKWEVRSELSTEDGTIKVNEEVCSSKEFTLEPDYFAEYKVGEWGTYEMTLTAETANGTHTIKDSFEVSNLIPFDVERTTATRIYPANKYPVTFNITAKQDFKGQVVEEVPSDFEIENLDVKNSLEILNQFQISNEKNVKKLVWDLDIKKGDEFSLGYQYDAPDESPQFYLLGPLQFKENGAVVFQEARQWQIASDAISFVTASTGATDAGGAWSHTTAAPSAAGNIIIVQVIQDGTTSSSAITITSATNVENLAGTDNVFTTLASGQAVGSAATGYQYLFIGRSLSTSAIVITGANSTNDDIYVRAYEFSGVHTGTTLSDVIENSTAGTAVNEAGTSTSCLDTGVTTLGTNRLALNFVALSDDSMGLAAFAGETGGDWTLATAIYESATGTDGTLGLMNAAIASAGTINGGSDTITSIGWGVIGFALIPYVAPPVVVSGTSGMRTGDTVKVSINGGAPYATTGTIDAGTGNWSISVAAADIASGNSVIAWTDTATAGNQSTAISKWDGSGDMTGMVLDANVLSIGSANSSGVTSAEVDDFTCASSGGGNVMHAFASSTLSVEGCSKTYTSEKIDILSANTLTIGASEILTTYDLTITGTLTSGGASTYNVAHNWTNNGTTFTASSSTVNMNGTTAQAINGSTSATFNNLTLSNSSAAVSVNTSEVVNGTLTVNASNILTPAAAVFISGSGTLTGSGTVQVTRTSAPPDFSSQYTISNKTLTNLTVAYVSDSAQTVSAVNYGNLSSSGAGARTLASSGTIGISGTFTVGTNSYTVTGSTVDYNGASQTVGTINYNNLTLSGSGTKTLQTGTTSIAGNFTLSGTASATLVGDLAVAGQVTVNTGTTLGLGSSGYTLTLSGSGAGTSRPLYMNGGSLTEGTNSTVLFTGTSASDIQNETYYNLTFAPTSGSPTYTLLGATTVTGKMTVGNGSNAVTLAANNQSLDLNGDFEIKASGIFTAPSSASFTIAGNYTNSGTLNNSSGKITFDAGATGKTINSGGTGSGKAFYDVEFNNSSGGWTIQTNDMKVAHNLSITDIANSADSWTLDTGRTLEVDGTYTITGTEAAYTKWTGSTFYLNGTSQTIGSKTQAAETYGTLQIGANTHIRMWQSTATAFTVDSTGSLYSMDHANVDGDLYIWGDYHVNTNDYWSYATDFDNTAVTRQVDVRIDPAAKVTVDSGDTLAAIGTGANRTTVSRQGASNGYEISCLSGGTINFQYTDFDYLDGALGLDIQSGATVTSLDYTDFDNLINNTSSDAFITVASSVIGSGTKTISGANFDNTGSYANFNVNRTGTDDTGYWDFDASTGTFDGEAYDGDDGVNEADPGMLRWDDSSAAILSLTCESAAVYMTDYNLGDSNNYNEKYFADTEECIVTDSSYSASWTLTLYSTNLAGTKNNLANSNIKLRVNNDPANTPTTVSPTTNIVEANGDYSLDSTRTIITGSTSAAGDYNVRITSRLESLNTLHAETGDQATFTFTVQ